MHKIYIAESHDPRINLAAEEIMTREAKMGEVTFFLWQNQNTVVIGRNQNPYKECDLGAIERDDVTLIRRLSGGGAVFHDLGNLNFSFCAHDKDYSLEKNLKVIIGAIQKFGLPAEFSGRNDILLDGKKFSGNAFSRIRANNCHHGTIMVDVDMTKLSNYLNVPPLKMQAKGIQSVRSRVTNLIDYAPDMTIEQLIDKLIEAFQEVFGPSHEPIVIDEAFLQGHESADKYQTWQWNVGTSPAYEVHFEKKFDWGLTDWHIDINQGKIARVKFFSDALVETDFRQLETDLIGTEYRKPAIRSVFSQVEPIQVRDDLLAWLDELEIGG
ncbi:MAG TPA: lipoate--protein ligase [Tissierellia bacterium]|nr:lipoate--protein ligase [Tissierellia bacterium]